jgi:hypothetical protein
LLVLCYGDIFDMSDNPEIVDAGDGQSLFLALSGGGVTYNFLSTINAPVPTIRP